MKKVLVVLFLSFASIPLFANQYMSQDWEIVSTEYIKDPNCVYCGNSEIGCNIGEFRIEVCRKAMFNDSYDIIGYKYIKRKILAGCYDGSGNYYNAGYSTPQILSEWTGY